MRASHSWLRAFVPHVLTPEQLRTELSAHVATVDALTSLRGELAPIVVARVLTAAPHPDSDHLWVTTVDDGSGTVLDVVCGAPNVEVGTLYPFARAGTRMPNGMVIERRRIRGAVSNGMLCSARELGLGDDHAGIYALNLEATPGTPLLDVLPVGDWQFEIDVLPNRPDLLCHVGLAREISAITGVALRHPPELQELPSVPDARFGNPDGSTDGVRISIRDRDGCPRYHATVIRGVRVGQSPEWLQERLASVGVRSISNVVDITNYFLHAYGQPMHAFDLARLRGPEIIVRAAVAGERLTTLDGVDRTLSVDTLVIADQAGAVAVAGVIGGRDSEIGGATTDILLEVANFDPLRIRRARRALGLNTDASHRFERGTDPAEVATAAQLAAALIVQLAGGRVEDAPVFVGDPVLARDAVRLRVGRVSRLLGAAVPTSEIRGLLTSIGFEIADAGSDELSVTPPSWRHDVSRDVDLIEDVARLRGFDVLSDELSPFRPSAVPDHPLHVVGRAVRDLLVAAGLAEVRPLPFVAGEERTHVRVTNPLAEDEPFLRHSILESLAKRAEYNLAWREGNIRLFEVGDVMVPIDGSVREELRVGALIMGARRPLHFTEPHPPRYDPWDAKALAMEVARRVFGEHASIVESDADGVLWDVRAASETVGEVRQLALDAPPWADAAFGCEIRLGVLPLEAVAPPGQHAYQNIVVPSETGVVGSSSDVGDGVGGDALAPSPVQQFSRPASVARYVPLPLMPAAEFDLAFIVPDEMPAIGVETTLREQAGELLEKIVLFDEFKGAGVPDGYRSLAWRLTFRHPERTLNDKEIAGRRQKLIASMERAFGITARAG
jgi:phenylalanyl-tRNA synthetase beta chain